MSPSNISRNISERREVLSYRQTFAAIWQRFIIENFDSPAHAAHVFQVDPTTAENWFEGKNAPQGWVVGKAIANPQTRASALQTLTGAA